MSYVAHSKSRRPLSRVKKELGMQLKTLKTDVRKLRKESDQQLSLDYESQQTFEYMNAQLRALRHAFGTLSDVLIEEIDAIRADMNSQKQAVETQLGVLGSAVEKNRQQVNVFAESVEQTRENTSVLFKQTETVNQLKADVAANRELAKNITEDVAFLRESVAGTQEQVAGVPSQIAEFKQLQAESQAILSRENQTLKDALAAQSRAQAEETAKQIVDLNSNYARQTEILELTIQKAAERQAKVRTSVEARLRRDEKEADAVQGQIELLKSDLEVQKRQMKEHFAVQSETMGTRFDSLHKAIQAFADVVQIPEVVSDVSDSSDADYVPPPARKTKTKTTKSHSKKR